MSSGIQQQRAAVEQMRREAGIKRISVSQAVEDLKVKVAQDVMAFSVMKGLKVLPDFLLVPAVCRRAQRRGFPPERIPRQERQSLQVEAVVV